jgi:YD repeat-containing protein
MRRIYGLHNYQVLSEVVNDSTTWSNTTWTTISDASHKLEIDWIAATVAGANNGGITFWVDGVQTGTFTNIDNDTRRVDYVKLGAVDGIDSGTRGAYYFDAFVSRRETYIGMRKPGYVELGMVDQVVGNAQNPTNQDAAQKSLAILLPADQTIRVTGEAPELSVDRLLAKPPAMKLAEESPLITTTVVISYTYDPLNRLTAADYDDGTYFHYTYDAVGNQLEEDTNGWANEYDYDAANRLVEVNGVDYLWDDNGNLLSDGVYTYTYDTANRLAGVSGAGQTVSYSYNGLGDRLSETVNGVPKQYTMDLNAGLTQVLQDETNTYLYGNGRIAQYGESGAEYFLGDALCSMRDYRLRGVGVVDQFRGDRSLL